MEKTPLEQISMPSYDVPDVGSAKGIDVDAIEKSQQAQTPTPKQAASNQAFYDASNNNQVPINILYAVSNSDTKNGGGFDNQTINDFASNFAAETKTGKKPQQILRDHYLKAHPKATTQQADQYVLDTMSDAADIGERAKQSYMARLQAKQKTLEAAQDEADKNVRTRNWATDIGNELGEAFLGLGEQLTHAVRYIGNGFEAGHDATERAAAQEAMKSPEFQNLPPLKKMDVINRSIPGWGDLFTEGVDKLSKITFGKTVSEYDKEAHEFYQGGLTSAQKLADKKQFVVKDKNGNHHIGAAFTDPRAYEHGVVQAIPQGIMAAVPAGVLAKGAFALNVARGMAPEFAAKIAATTAMIADKASNALFQGIGTADEVEQKVDKLTKEQLKDSDAIKALMDEGFSFEGAKHALARDRSAQGMLVGGLAGAAFSGYGDALIAKTIFGGQSTGRILRAIGLGGVNAVEGGVTGAAAKAGGNAVVKQDNPNQDLGEGVAQAGVSQAILGGTVGFGMGLLRGGSNSGSEETPNLPAPTDAEGGIPEPNQGNNEPQPSGNESSSVPDMESPDFAEQEQAAEPQRQSQPTENKQEPKKEEQKQPKGESEKSEGASRVKIIFNGDDENPITQTGTIKEITADHIHVQGDDGKPYYVPKSAIQNGDVSLEKLSPNKSEPESSEPEKKPAENKPEPKSEPKQQESTSPEKSEKQTEAQKENDRLSKFESATVRLKGDEVGIRTHAIKHPDGSYTLKMDDGEEYHIPKEEMDKGEIDIRKAVDAHDEPQWRQDVLKFRLEKMEDTRNGITRKKPVPAEEPEPEQTPAPKSNTTPEEEKALADEKAAALAKWKAKQAKKEEQQQALEQPPAEAKEEPEQVPAKEEEQPAEATEQPEEPQQFLGKDGKPKWFGSKPKAMQFIEKKGATDTHEAIKQGNRWVITPKETASNEVPKTEVAEQEQTPTPAMPESKEVPKSEVDFKSRRLKEKVKRNLASYKRESEALEKAEEAQEDAARSYTDERGNVTDIKSKERHEKAVARAREKVRKSEERLNNTFKEFTDSEGKPEDWDKAVQDTFGHQDEFSHEEMTNDIYGEEGPVKKTPLPDDGRKWHLHNNKEVDVERSNKKFPQWEFATDQKGRSFVRPSDPSRDAELEKSMDDARDINGKIIQAARTDDAIQKIAIAIMPHLPEGQRALVKELLKDSDVKRTKVETSTTRSNPAWVKIEPDSDTITMTFNPDAISDLAGLKTFIGSDFPAAGVAQAVAHELVHAATQMRFNKLPKDSPLRAQAKLLLTHLRAENKKLKSSGKAARTETLRNVDEMMAYGLTDPDAVKVFKDMPGINPKQSFFDAFVSLIRRVLGLKADQNSALGDIIQLVSDLMNRGDKDNGNRENQPDTTEESVSNTSTGRENDANEEQPRSERSPSSSEGETELNVPAERETQPQQLDEAKAVRDAVSKVIKAKGLAEIRTNNDLNKIASKALGRDISGKENRTAQKMAQEAYESAAMAQRRKDVIGTLNREGVTANNIKDLFDKLVDEYSNQPRLDVATANSIKMQAYSTPAPLSLVANLLADVHGDTSIFEPTAGNGLLLMTGNKNNTFANELDPERAASLKWQGFKGVTQADATTPPVPALLPEPVDRVIANPPFGKLRNADGKPYRLDITDDKGRSYIIGELDHLIAIRALSAMKDDGKAALILGADKNVPSRYVGTTKAFMNWLYQNFNVSKHIELDGRLYSRQGAAWPVQLIVVDGRLTGNDGGRFAPVEGEIPRYNNWGELYEATKSLLVPAGKRHYALGAGNGSVRAKPATDNGTGAVSPTRGSDVTDRGNASRGTVETRTDDWNELSRSSVDGERDTRQLGDASPTPRDRLEQAKTLDPIAEDGKTVSQPTDTLGMGGDDAVKNYANSPVDTEVKPVNDFQAEYKSGSKNQPKGLLTPINMALAEQKALAEVKNQVGDIDEFVKKQVGYDNDKSLNKAMMGSQIDGVAMAIHQIKNTRRALIIGDDTGVGKARQAAAILQYAQKVGKIPVFMTAKPNLFTDMYDETMKIGKEFKPLIMNRDGYVSKNKKKLFKLPISQVKKHMKYIAENQKMPDSHNAIVLTYSQITGKAASAERRQFLNSIADNAILVLDESHTVAGNSEVGKYAQRLTNMAHGVSFLSATYAKRPENLALYMRTDLGLAADTPEQVIAALSEGGTGLQSYAASKLAEAGQMIRRERSYEGVTIQNVKLPERNGYYEKEFDKTTGILRDIQNLSAQWAAYVDQFLTSEIQQEEGLDVSVGGSKSDKNIKVNLFSSIIHNYIAQLTMGLKAEETANMAIKALKNGQRPIIAFQNTLERALDKYMEKNGLKVGDSVGDYTFGDLLQSAADNTLVYNVKQPGEEKSTPRPYDISKLPPHLKAIYNRISKNIAKLNIKAAPSPVDTMRGILAKAGYSSQEVTGRSKMIDVNDNGRIMNKPKEEQDKFNVVDNFNHGRTDVLFLNGAGSTGLNAHSSQDLPKAAQGQRHMFVMQADLNIDTFKQMLGRANRTGQVNKPEITLPWLPLPTETRTSSILSRKMKSMNANTTGNTESSNSIDSVDLLNKYGDEIVTQYMLNNSQELGAYNPQLINPQLDDQAAYFLGKLAITPVSVQKRVLTDITRDYLNYIEYLDRTGQNDLKNTHMDLEAKLEGRTEVVPGDPKRGVFSEPVYMNRVSAKSNNLAGSFDDAVKEYDNFGGGKAVKPIVDKAKTAIDSFRSIVDKRKELAENELAKAKNKTKTLEDRVTAANAAKDSYESRVTSLSSAFLSDEGWLRPGTSVQLKISQGEDPVLGFITSLDHSYDGTGDPTAASKWTIGVSIAHPLGFIRVPFSRKEFFELAPDNTPQKYLAEAFERAKDLPARETRYIMTGNLIQASIQTTRRGIVAPFSTSNGKIVQGMVMPRSFNPESDIAKKAQISSQEQFNWFRNQDDDRIKRTGMNSANGDVSLHRNTKNNKFILTFPASKTRGSKYWGDPRIEELIGPQASKGGGNLHVTVDDETASKFVDVMNTISPMELIAPEHLSEAERSYGFEDPQEERGKDISFMTAQSSVLRDKDKARINKRVIEAGKAGDTIGAKQKEIAKAITEEWQRRDEEVNNVKPGTVAKVKADLDRRMRLGEITEGARDLGHWGMDRNEGLANRIRDGLDLDRILDMMKSKNFDPRNMAGMAYYFLPRDKQKEINSEYFDRLENQVNPKPFPKIQLGNGKVSEVAISNLAWNGMRVVNLLRLYGLTGDSAIARRLYQMKTGKYFPSELVSPAHMLVRPWDVRYPKDVNDFVEKVIALTRDSGNQRNVDNAQRFVNENLARRKSYFNDPEESVLNKRFYSDDDLDNIENVKFSMGPKDKELLRQRLREYPEISVLMSHDKIKIEDPENMPTGKDGQPSYAYTDKEGIIHVRGGIRNIRGLIMHEMFHSRGKHLLGEQWDSYLNRLDRIYRQHKNDTTGYWAEAAQRVRNAGITDPKLAAEEFGAYAIENAEYAPTGFKNFFQRMMGNISDKVRRHLHINREYISPFELQAFAKAALKDHARELEGRHFVPTREGMKQWLSDRVTAGMPLVLKGAPMDRLIEEVADHMPTLKTYLKLRREMHTYRNKRQEGAGERIKQWKSVAKSKAVADDLADLMSNSTIYQIDPTKPFESKLEPDEDMTPEEEARMQAYDDMKATYDALPKDAQQLYKDVRDDYIKQNEELDQIIQDNINDAVDAEEDKIERRYQDKLQDIKDQELGGIDLQKALKRAKYERNTAMMKTQFTRAARIGELRKMFESNRLDGPYFPLFRKGKYFVSVRDADGKTLSFSMRESVKEARTLGEQFRKEYGDDVQVVTGLMDNSDELRGAVDPNFAADIDEILQGGGVDDAVRDMVWQRYLSSMPEVSMRKRFMHRKNQPGFSRDAMQAYASSMFHSSHQMARMKYAVKMQRQLDLADDQIRMTKDGDVARDRAILNDMRKRHDFVMNPVHNKWSNRASSLAFTYFLGANPASAVVNLTQSVMLGVPILSAHFGTVGKSATKAAAESFVELNKALYQFARGKGSLLRNKNLTDEERAALRYGYDSGALDESFVHDLAGISEKGMGNLGVREKVMSAISYFFHHAERLNREITFLTGYRMSRKRGVAHQQAVEDALMLNNKIHFDYSSENKPTLMQGDIARTVLTFQNYRANMLFRLFRDTHEIFSKDPAARKEALIQLGGITANMALMAGLNGTWMVGAAFAIASLFTEEPEEQLRAGMKKAIGPTATGMLLDGVPGQLLDVSLSGRIGMGDLFFRSPTDDLEGSDEFHYWMDQILGAPFAIPQNILEGVQLANQGHVERGFEKAMPSSISHIMKAGRYAMDGGVMTKSGAMTTTTNLYDDVMEGLGFTPLHVTQQYMHNNAAYNIEQHIYEKRKQVMNAIFFAQKYGNDDDLDKANKLLIKYNEQYPSYPIKGQNIRTSIRSKNRALRKMRSGIDLNPKTIPAIEDLIGD